MASAGRAVRRRSGAGASALRANCRRISSRDFAQKTSRPRAPCAATTSTATCLLAIAGGKQNRGADSIVPERPDPRQVADRQGEQPAAPAEPVRLVLAEQQGGGGDKQA